MGAWLRERGATPNVVRARDLGMLALSAESVERTSLLADQWVCGYMEGAVRTGRAAAAAALGTYAR